MLQQTSNTNIRIKKGINMENSKLMRTGMGLGSASGSKYSESFGKYFIDKNKDRLNGFNTTAGSKDTDRYLVNVSKLQRMNSSTAENNRSSMVNHNLSNSVNNQQFHANSLSKHISTSQSHRSHLLTVNVKRLPRLNSSSTNGWNVSHNKIEILKQGVENLAEETIDLSAHTRDFAITFGNIKHSIEQHTNNIQKQLNSKVNDLTKLIAQTIENHKHRSISLQEDCNQIKDRNAEVKQFLELIQQKIQNVQNSLGLTTAHHKHLV